MMTVIGYVVLSGKIVQSPVTTLAKARELLDLWDKALEGEDAHFTIAQVEKLIG